VVEWPKTLLALASPVPRGQVHCKASGSVRRWPGTVIGRSN